jgi:hypothetical protein
MLAMWEIGAMARNPTVAALASTLLGFSQLWKFRRPAVHATHVSDWTDKA